MEEHALKHAAKVDEQALMLPRGHSPSRSSSATGKAAALRAGTDMACESYADLRRSLSERLVSVGELDAAVARVLASKFRLGVFDPPGRVPYSRLGLEVLGAPAHKAKAVEAAQKGEAESPLFP